MVRSALQDGDVTHPTLEALVLRARSGFADVWLLEEERPLRCHVAGRLKRGRVRRSLLVAGDRVLVRRESEDEGLVQHVLPRRTRLGRRQPGAGGIWREDVLVANVELLLCVVSFGRPCMEPRLIDRFLLVAELGGVEAVLVANKLDLGPSAEEEVVLHRYEAIGYETLRTSAVTGRGVDRLRDRLCSSRAAEGGSLRLAAVAGPSGVGKSRLMQAVEPSLQVRVGEVSEAVGKGRHTTRVAELHRLSCGGWLADTPGIRELGAFGASPSEVALGFREITALAGDCAFGDCRHREEPACSVREGLRSGRVHPERYESYLKLLEEAEEAERRRFR